MRGILIGGLVALALVGCRRVDDTETVIIEPIVAPPGKEAPPREPLVSCAQLVEKDGVMTGKDTGKPFTGSTVTYVVEIGDGFGIQEYVDGAADGWKLLPDGMAPADPRCRDAFHREVARRGERGAGRKGKGEKGGQAF